MPVFQAHLAQQSNDPLVFTNTNIPGLDRRFPFFNGGGRTIVPAPNNTMYRSAWCRHGWRAQERKPAHLQNTQYTIFGCRGFVLHHEEIDDWDCGYAEQGVTGLGVPSIQILNQAWDGTMWPFPTPGEFYQRKSKILSDSSTDTPPASPSKTVSSSSSAQSSPTAPRIR
ncbi:unnamed protein product [Peniophora sp. CBMAI 1063]|nr:unnamed protein product [Peniophora sp. CBMAI 1063]